VEADKRVGSESSEDEDKAQADFFTAARMMVSVLEEFESQELHVGASVGGALTQLISHLIQVSPDTPTAFGLLSSCMSKAAYQHEVPTLSPDLPDDGRTH